MPVSPEPAARDRVLAEALDAAHSIVDPDARLVAVEQVGRLAAIQGVKAVLSEVLIDLPDPAGRANIHYHWALRSIAMGVREEARQHLDRARDGLLGGGRWRPRCEWLSKELAASDLASAHALLGDVDSVHGLVEFTAEGGMARASIRRSALVALQTGGARGVEVAWERAVKDALALSAEDDRRRALVDLGRTAAQEGLGSKVEDLLERAFEEQEWTAIQRCLMATELGEALAAVGEHRGALRLWNRVGEWVQEGWGEPAEPEKLQSGVDLLCRLAIAAQSVGAETAAALYGMAVRETGQTPLPPDPNARYPWKSLFRAARQEPELSSALRDLLRQRSVVPPGWCYALGIMELESGRPDRAERAASALEKGHAFNPSDAEPLWLAALLWARTGQVDRALDAMYPVLQDLGDDTGVELPGQSGGASHVELLFVRGLVAGKAIERAAELGRTVIDPELRARLLTVAGWAWLAEDEQDRARALAVEAFHALEESLRSDHAPGGGALGPALELVELLWRAEDPRDAMELLSDVMERMGTGPGVLVIPVVCRHALRVRDQEGLFSAHIRACIERCTAPDDPAERCELLLLLAEQIPAR
jgi:tetratricopeptide (TPR) repeat protein